MPQPCKRHPEDDPITWALGIKYEHRGEVCQVLIMSFLLKVGNLVVLETLSPSETTTACMRMLCLVSLGRVIPAASHKIWGWVRLFYNPSFIAPMGSYTNKSHNPFQIQMLTTPCPLMTIHSRTPQTWKFHCDTLTSSSFLGAERTDTAHRLVLSEAVLLLMYMFVMHVPQDRKTE